MKIPKTFIPDNNLENKVEDLLKPANPIKGIEEPCYQRRRILVYNKNPTELSNDWMTELSGDKIYVQVKKNPRTKEGYILRAKSDHKFFAPQSGSNTVPYLTGKNKVETSVKNEILLYEYLKSLKYNNKGRIAWGHSKQAQKLKHGYKEWVGFVKFVINEDENT
jgi:hypothetical protein